MSRILNKFKFNYRLMKRVIMVAPRKSIEVKKLYINYAILPADGVNDIVIKYRFRNALWYCVNDIKTLETTFTLPKNTKEISLIVHGLKETCTYTLLFKPENIDVLKITRAKHS